MPRRIGKFSLHEENAWGRNPEDAGCRDIILHAKYYFQVSFVVLIDCYPSVFSHHAFEEWPSQMQNTVLAR